MLRNRGFLFGKPSIMRNLTWGLVLTVTVVLVLFNMFFYWRSANQIQSDLDARATDIADRLSGVLGAPLWNYDNRTIGQIAGVYSNLEEVVYLRILDDKDYAIYESKKETPGVGSISRAQDVVYEDRVVGRVEISISQKNIQQTQRNSLLSTALSTLGIAAAIVVASQLLFRRFLNQPLNELTRGLDQIAQGKYEHRLAAFNLVDMDTIAQGVNVMAGQIAERDRQLREMVDTLEDRVADRTRDLEVAAGVSRQVTRELTLDALLSHVAELTQQAFGFYQVQVFLVNEAEQTLDLKAAAGAVAIGALGQRGSRFPLSVGPGLISAAGREQKMRVSNDVLNDMQYLPVDSLRNTRSEVALPILFAGSLLGVLDLQAKELNRFSQSDLDVLQTLAEQIAIAVRNANLYEGAVEARKRAELADTVKSQFLASVSHELRTPLNAIINFTMFVTRGKMGPVTEKQNEALTKVVTSARHLLSLINDVLDISKIEAGSLELYVEDDIDVKAELSNLISIAQQLLGEKPIQVITDIEDSLPLLTGDRQRINQIMLNLISNACKFTEQGSITISTHQQNGDIVLSVKDTGPGIAPEEHTAIFESFRQSEAGLRQGKGTGLGLPIAQRLAEAHGGRIWLESALEQGATFYVALPIKPEHLKLTRSR